MTWFDRRMLVIWVMVYSSYFAWGIIILIYQFQLCGFLLRRGIQITEHYHKGILSFNQKRDSWTLKWQQCKMIQVGKRVLSSESVAFSKKMYWKLYRIFLILFFYQCNFLDRFKVRYANGHILAKIFLREFRCAILDLKYFIPNIFIKNINFKCQVVIVV